MQNNRNGIKANNSSLVQKIKSFFQLKIVAIPTIYTHPTYLEQQKRKATNLNELSQEARQDMDKLFERVFSKVQFSKS